MEKEGEIEFLFKGMKVYEGKLLMTLAVDEKSENTFMKAPRSRGHLIAGWFYKSKGRIESGKVVAVSTELMRPTERVADDGYFRLLGIDNKSEMIAYLKIKEARRKGVECEIKNALIFLGLPFVELDV